MSYITTPVAAPAIVATEAIAIAAVATNVLGANVVYLYVFELSAPTTFSTMKWRLGTAATGTCDLGVYTLAGTLLDHTGAITNIASTNMSAALSLGNLTLGPGLYFIALTCSNATDNVFGVALGNPAIMSRCRQATNASGATLPATTGGYTDLPAKFPSFALFNAAGLT